MKFLISLIVAMIFSPAVYAQSSLDGLTLPEYNFGDLTPQNVAAEFPLDAPRAGGSLNGATFRWERDKQRHGVAASPALP